jgi:phosphoglycerate dehydrogenase-like enzyme
MTATSALNVLWLDPASATEVEFMRGLVPDSGLSISATPADAVGPSTERLRAADVIVTRTRPVTAATIAASPNLKLIQKYGGRPDRLDLDAARTAGIPVAVMPLRGCIAVAELAMALILALSKQLVEAHAATVDGRYRDLGLTPARTSQRSFAFQWMKLPRLLEIDGRRLGIVGFGEIGTEVAKRARAFQMEILYHKRDPLPEWLDRDLGVRPAPLDEVLATADFVTVHTPHGPATDPLLAAREIGLMKPTASLINTCRGPVVDEAALTEALATGRIAGAGLDVFDEEPLPFDHPLTRLPNVILTPHIGGGTGGARDKQMSDVLGNVVRFARGEAPLHRIV